MTGKMKELKITWDSSMKFQKITEDIDLLDIGEISEDEVYDIFCAYLFGHYDINDDFAYITLDNGNKYQFYFGSVGVDSCSNIEYSVIPYDCRSAV